MREREERWDKVEIIYKFNSDILACVSQMSAGVYNHANTL